MKVGIIGTGRMAKKFANTLRYIKEAECYAVASRTYEKAEEFALKCGFGKAYGSYEELVKDEHVELIYVATPHSSHFKDTKMCLENGKAVLCEKTFMVNMTQAVEIKTLSKKKGVFVAEAMWTRYMPSRAIIDKVVDSGIIGDIHMMTANLCYPVTHKKRIMSPDLAGGALLDVGVYGVNFALMHFGTDIVDIKSSVQFTDTGVDGSESITLHYRNGKIAVLSHSIYTKSDRQGIFYGSKGYIVVDNINNPKSISIYDTADKLLEKYTIPEQISGYEYEIRECISKISNGETESFSMPLDDSILLMSVLDGIRNQWGYMLPCE